MRKMEDQVGEVKGQVVEVKGQVGEVKGQVVEVKGQVGEVKGQIGKVEVQVSEVKESQQASAAKSGSQFTESLRTSGKREMAYLRKHKLLRRLTTVNGRSVLDQKQKEELENLKQHKNFSEASLCQFFTPIFQGMVKEASNRVGYQLCLVNCEWHRWVEGIDKHASKCGPDFFVTHPAFYKSIDSSKNQVSGCERFRFGVPSHWCLRDSIQICIEMMLDDWPKHVGQVKTYSGLISHNTVGAAVDEERIQETSFLLGDTTTFRLLACFQGVVRLGVEGQWDAPGSRDKIIRFIMKKSLGNPFAQAMDQLCRQFNVTHSNLSASSECLLGLGSDGRVFQVQSNTGALYALKMATGDSGCSAIWEEYTKYITFRDVLSQSGSFVSMCNYYMDPKRQYAGLLVEPVGESLEKQEDQILQALHSLRSLTKLRLRHGDARLANVIWHRNKALWVDLRRTGMQGGNEEPREVFVEETETFFKSFGRNFDVEKLQSSAMSFFDGNNEQLKVFVGDIMTQIKLELKKQPSESIDITSYSSFSEDVMEDNDE